MRQLTVVGISEDGTRLVLTTAGSPPAPGSSEPEGEFTVALDDRLRAATRGDRARLGQLQIRFESALRPRDIQARIRAGDTAEEVARAAGIPLDRVLRFAAPVLAEREHVVDEARRNPLHRRSEPGGLSLDDAVAAKLAAHGVDPETVRWDARRRTDGGWVVSAAYRGGSRDRSASFRYDPHTRTAMPDDDDARWIAGETTGPGRGRPGPAGPRALAPADEFDAMVAAELAAAGQTHGPEGIGRDGAPLAPDPLAPVPAADRGGDRGEQEDEETIDVPFAGRWPEMPAPAAEAQAVPAPADRPRPLPSRPRAFGRRERTPSRPQGEPAVPAASAEPEPEPAEPTAPAQPAAAQPTPAQPVQPAAEPAPVQPAAAEQRDGAGGGQRPAAARNRRQAVPSWDEIMFGRKGD